MVHYRNVRMIIMDKNKAETDNEEEDDQSSGFNRRSTDPSIGDLPKEREYETRQIHLTKNVEINKMKAGLLFEAISFFLFMYMV